MSATLMAGSFPVSDRFHLLVLFLEKSLADFPFWGVLGQLTFNLSSFKASYFSDLAFGCLSLLSFFLSEWNPFLLG